MSMLPLFAAAGLANRMLPAALARLKSIAPHSSSTHPGLQPPIPVLGSDSSTKERKKRKHGDNKEDDGTQQQALLTGGFAQQQHSSPQEAVLSLACDVALEAALVVLGHVSARCPPQGSSNEALVAPVLLSICAQAQELVLLQGVWCPFMPPSTAAAAETAAAGGPQGAAVPHQQLVRRDAVLRGSVCLMQGRLNPQYQPALPVVSTIQMPLLIVPCAEAIACWC